MSEAHPGAPHGSRPDAAALRSRASHERCAATRGRTTSLAFRPSSRCAPVAIARFYGKRGWDLTIESHQHDSAQAAPRDRKITQSAHTMRAIQARGRQRRKPVLPADLTGKPNAARCNRTLSAHAGAKALAPAATPVLEGREPATSKQA